tara:strand:- start:403 stop:666 length:264 start_codon:yes stop_codon:yes gene_type:complete
MKKKQNKLDSMMEAAMEQMVVDGFSENRKLVALQRGGLRKQMKVVCNESLSDHKRAVAYMSIEMGLKKIGDLPESLIDKVVQGWEAQ